MDDQIKISCSNIWKSPPAAPPGQEVPRDDFTDATRRNCAGLAIVCLYRHIIVSLYYSIAVLAHYRIILVLYDWIIGLMGYCIIVLLYYCITVVELEVFEMCLVFTFGWLELLVCRSVSNL